MNQNVRVRNASRELVTSARTLRRQQTTAEQLLWNTIRGKRAFPYRVRRQHAVGQFILDLWIPDVRVAIEIDGSVHDGDAAAEQDFARTELLEAYGLRVIRFRNDEVMNDLDGVIVRILATIEELGGVQR